MVIAASGLGRRKGPMGRWEVQTEDGRWVPEEEADMKWSGPIPAPANPPGEITRRFEKPDPVAAPEAPAPAPPQPPAPRPSERQRRAWELCGPPPEGQGMYWADAAPILGVDVSNTSRLVRRYMELMGITGEVPGRLPEDERIRRQVGARKAAHAAVTTSALRVVAAAPGADQDADAAVSDPDEGAAALPPAGTSPDPEPAPETPPSGAGDGPVMLSKYRAVWPPSAAELEDTAPDVFQAAAAYMGTGFVMPLHTPPDLQEPAPASSFAVLSAELARVRDEQTEAESRARILAEIAGHLEAAIDGHVRLSLADRP